MPLECSKMGGSSLLAASKAALVATLTGVKSMILFQTPGVQSPPLQVGRRWVMRAAVSYLTADL